MIEILEKAAYGVLTHSAPVLRRSGPGMQPEEDYSPCCRYSGPGSVFCI